LHVSTALPHTAPLRVSEDWLQSEARKPFETLVLPDSRWTNYHDMGPVMGNPVLYFHMGYALVRWNLIKVTQHSQPI